MWESKVDIFQVQELRCRTTLYLGVGAIDKMRDIVVDIKNRGIDKVVVVSSRSAYIKCGAWKTIEPALVDNGSSTCFLTKSHPILMIRRWMRPLPLLVNLAPRLL